MSSRRSKVLSARRVEPLPPPAEWLYGRHAGGLVFRAAEIADLKAAEIDELLAALRREVPMRLTVMALLAVICALYLPWPLVLAWVVVTLLCDRFEVASFRQALLRRADPAPFRAGLLAVYAQELAFSLPSALIWHADDAFTKAISVGAMAAALMRLPTLRSIVPATGLAGCAAIASLIAVSNSYYWLHLGNYHGFLFTSVIAVTSIGYVAAAVLQNHRQQWQAALGRLALQQASEAKTHFLSHLSHELRTPLNAIIGVGTLAQQRVQTEDLAEMLGVLVQSAKGLGLVLDDVLDRSAIEEGRITLRPREANLRDEIGLIIALFRPQAEAAGLTLRPDIAADVPLALRLDFDRLRQCLANLLSNALKHTREGEIVVRLRREKNLLIEVQDTGTGIPPGQEEAIFHRYARASAEPGGHGLGLTICRAILRQMGGDIVALPSPRGATIRLWLPIVEVPPPPEPENPALPSFAGRVVLVVDDIATNRLVAATYLGLLQADPIEAASGAEALALLRQRPKIDLVLLDIDMPQMDGVETFRSMRRQGACPPVIAMTADASDRDRLAYLAAGMEGYVAKPIALERLGAEMARVLAV